MLVCELRAELIIPQSSFCQRRGEDVDFGDMFLLFRHTSRHRCRHLSAPDAPNSPPASATFLPTSKGRDAREAPKRSDWFKTAGARPQTRPPPFSPTVIGWTANQSLLLWTLALWYPSEDVMLVTERWEQQE